MSDLYEVPSAEDLRGQTVVLGIGNTLMGDDGVGAAVVRRLAETGCDAVLLERPTADLGLLRLFRSGARIFVVDAVACGGPPGAIFRFTPDQAGITTLRSNNTHGMGVGFLVANARLAGGRPDVTVFGVQVDSIMPDADRLTPVVNAAVDDVAALIRAEVDGAAAVS